MDGLNTRIKKAMMEIIIKNLQRKPILLNPQQIGRILKTLLKVFYIQKGFLSFVFVSDQKIKEINKKYLKRNYATDVLAFDLRNPRFSVKGKASGKTICSLEGEVFISVARAYQNAKIYENTPKEEIVLYIIHGVLHLLGYDDHSRKGRALMQRKEKEAIKFLKTRRLI